MSVRFHTATNSAGPVAPDASAVIAKNDLVRVVSGVVVAMADGGNAGLAVALDKFPDAEYEEGSTAKPAVQLALVGEDVEIELPLTTVEASQAIAAANIGAGPYRINADGEVNILSTTNGVFTIRRLGPDTKFGDLTGTVIGVISDAAAF